MSEPESTAELSHENRSSIEIRRDAKGAYGWTIKLYFTSNPTNDIETGLDANQALGQLRHIDRTLRSQYAPDQLPF